MKSNQSKKEDANKFRCMICNQWSKRGVFVKVICGIYANLGYEVKVCKKPECKECAKNGIFDRYFKQRLKHTYADAP